MSGNALQFGWTIDKYVGDAILIFFGDLETKVIEADAVACVKMAIAMRKRMRELESVWRACRGWEIPSGKILEISSVGNGLPWRNRLDGRSPSPR